MINLRPLERRILLLQSRGYTTQDLAIMFRRSPQQIERIGTYINMKLGESRGTS